MKLKEEIKGPLGQACWALETQFGKIAGIWYNREGEEWSITINICPRLFGSSAEVVSFSKTESGEHILTLREVKD